MPQRNEMRKKCRKLHNEELAIYTSPNSVSVIELRRLCWTGH